MVWSHLSITQPGLVYILLGGFTSLFMLCSSIIKQRLYLGEATIATIFGICIGRHAADLVDPTAWGSVDIVTIELSRIVLVVQCFAVGVELPKYYMERHWRSVLFLLIPVTLFAWLFISLIVWWLIDPLSWLESLVIAACVTGTDSVLASSIVGKSKFALGVPKHLRDLLSAESGCNDAMSFIYAYLALYLIQYHKKAKEVSFYFIVYVILYECFFGAFYGLVIGYIARHAIKFAEKHDLVERRSFLAFYFIVALFCAGSGGILGLDDLLVGFSAGVGFSNDGWFREKTEQSRVSNVIDLLLNLTYFVYLGTVIPWEEFNDNLFSMRAWRLLVLAIFVLLFRRIPIIMALKPFIPDIKSWREALFVGHFGPIGAGAIFIAMLARGELEHHKAVPLPELPSGYVENYMLMYLVWPVVSFLVISSIVVHGSSVALFSLGKSINTLALTVSYSEAGEEGPAWISTLPRLSQPFIQTEGLGALQLDQQVSADRNPFDKSINSTPDKCKTRERITTSPFQESTSRFSCSGGNGFDGGATDRRNAVKQISSSLTPFVWSLRGLKSRIAEIYEAETEKRRQKGLRQGYQEPARAYQFGSTVIVEDRDGEVIKTFELNSPKRGNQGEGSSVMSAWNCFGASVGFSSPNPSNLRRGNADFGAVRPEALTASSNRSAARSSVWTGIFGRTGNEQGKRSSPPTETDLDNNLRFIIGDGGTRLTKDEFVRKMQEIDEEGQPGDK